MPRSTECGQFSIDYAASIATTLPSRSALMSRIGGCPKKRLYSPLNWLTLSYSTPEAALVTVALPPALVPPLVGRARRIKTVPQHSLPGHTQPELLLELQWAHRRQSSELMIDRKSTRLNSSHLGI